MSETSGRKTGFPSAIPGTKVFDYHEAQRGYDLNMFFMSFNNAANRERFKMDPPTYMNDYPLTDEQKAAIARRDYNALMNMGGNIYFITKLIPIDGVTFQHVSAAMSGVTEAQFKQMMLGGGRPHDADKES